MLATCLTKEGAQDLKAVTSDKLKTFQMDVTNSQQIKDVYSEIKKEISPAGLWGLVNNAGILYLCPIEWTPLDVFKRSADVNLWGMIDVTKTFLPLVKECKGRVVNLSSISGRFSANCYGSYAVSKYGVEAFSDALRREMHPWGVKVSMLEPGSVLTNICAPDAFERQLRKGWDQLSTELKDEYGEQYLNRVIEVVKNIYRTSDVSHVVDAIVDGLTSSSPPDRYVIGRDARYLFIPFIYFPASVGDFIMRVGFKAPLPQGCLK